MQQSFGSPRRGTPEGALHAAGKHSVCLPTTAYRTVRSILPFYFFTASTSLLYHARPRSPVERADSPEVRECRCQHADKNYYLPITGPPCFTHGNRPREQKYRL